MPTPTSTVSSVVRHACEHEAYGRERGTIPTTRSRRDDAASSPRRPSRRSSWQHSACEVEPLRHRIEWTRRRVRGGEHVAPVLGEAAPRRCQCGHGSRVGPRPTCVNRKRRRPKGSGYRRRRGRWRADPGGGRPHADGPDPCGHSAAGRTYGETRRHPAVGAAGAVALKSTTDPQAATIRFGTARRVSSGARPNDADVTIETDVNAPRRRAPTKPKVTGFGAPSEARAPGIEAARTAAGLVAGGGGTLLDVLRRDIPAPRVASASCAPTIATNSRSARRRPSTSSTGARTPFQPVLRQHGARPGIARRQPLRGRLAAAHR